MYKNLYGQKGYKAAYNYMCRNVEVKPGVILTEDGVPRLCCNGFHYCIKPESVLKYYTDFSRANFFEVKDLSKRTDVGKDKCSTSKLKIVREITDLDEIFALFKACSKFNKNKVLVYRKYKSENLIKEHFYNDSGFQIHDKIYSYKTNRLIEETIYESGKDSIKIVKTYSPKGDLKTEYRYKKYRYNPFYFFENNIEHYCDKHGNCIKKISKNYEQISRYCKFTNDLLYKKVSRIRNSRQGVVKPKNEEKIVKNVIVDSKLLKSYYKNMNFEVKYVLTSDNKISEVKYSSGDFENFKYDNHGRFVEYTNSIGSFIRISYKNRVEIKSLEINFVNDTIPNYISSKYIDSDNLISKGYKNYKFLINSSNFSLLTNESSYNDLNFAAINMTSKLLDASLIVQ